MSTRPDMQSHCFLVVDDVRFTRTTLVRMLRQMGSENVHEAEDGAAALRWLSQPGCVADCLITDIQMPNMNGLELLKAIRTGEAGIRRDLPVVILTTASELAGSGTAFLLNLDEFIAKPVSQHALRMCLDRIFDPVLAAQRSASVAAPEVYRDIDLSGGSAEAVTPSGTAGATSRETPLEEVPEGAVLARDLLHDNGRLLLPAGTRLDKGIVARIRQLAASSGLPGTIWIVT